jgi:glutamyl-tRNA synthetase
LSASATAEATGSAVVTRFAPSPTGFLHIGGARTALFNWLFSRHHGGKFLLRIEDTDRARSTDAAIEAILDGLKWLGLDWDDETVFQFSRAERHAAVAHQMLAEGKAYRCWMSQEELAAQREAAQAEKRPFKVDSPWRDRTDGPVDQPHVVRLRADRGGETTIHDRVQGAVTVANDILDDMVLLRSDGTPTYMLAVVVDDHDMGVTHVIRGDDHLNNSFRQLGILRAMDWPQPTYAHIPLIHGADGAKLSKRHGALGVDAYRDELGLLPEAVSNYLLRLGWGHGDEEIIARPRAVELFDLAAVGRSPSRFDLKKLEHLNGIYMRESDDARLAALVAEKLGLDTPQARDLLHRAMPSLKVRAKNINELADSATFLFRTRPMVMDEDAGKLLEGSARAILARARDALAGVDDWSAEALEAAIRQVAEQESVGLGKLAQPLRAALTGRTTSPGIFDVLVLLGRAESLARLDDQVTETIDG